MTNTSTPAPSTSRVIKFTGHHHLRNRLILSLLSHRPILISQIRPSATSPGLLPHEISFLRLLERLTEGTRIEISYTGTSFLFHPGVIAGGTVVHQCPVSHGVGWFLEPMLMLGPWGKKDLQLTLKGVTTDARNASVDVIRTSLLPHLVMFLENQQGIELRITKRGHPPLGGGEVTFTCPSVRAIKSGFEFTNPGKINKIRGIAHSVRVSPQLANRLVSSARSVLNRYIPDVYIYTDVYKGEESGKSPGYALTLLSSSTTSVLHSSEATSCPPSSSPTSFTPQTPEELGIQAAYQLLSEIKAGGCIDRGAETLVTTFLVLGAGEDVGKVLIGARGMGEGLVEHLRDLKKFWGVSFKIKEVEGAEGGLMLAAVGIGYSNTAKKTG